MVDAVKVNGSGVYLKNGREIVPASENVGVSLEEAKKGTIAYSILKGHNTAEPMDKLTTLLMLVSFRLQELQDSTNSRFLMYLQTATIHFVR